MKAKSVIVLLVGITLFISGCEKANIENGVNKNDSVEQERNEQAYIVDGNGTDDAINTVQMGTEYRVTGPMSELRDSVVEILGENYWPDSLLSSEEFAERTGISEYMYDSFLAEYQHTEAGIDMMILINAKEDEVGAVEKYLNEYRELLLRIYEQQPQNKAKVYASRIETINNYVCYVQLGADIAFLEGRGENDMVQHCQQENERALDVIEKRVLNT